MVTTLLILSVKIAKWYEDFHSVVWDGNAAKVNGKSVTIDVAPTADDAGKFLKADGTWATPADTTYTFAEGTTNGAFDVTTGGKTTSVPVHGLGSAAFVESETFAAAKHTHAIDDVTGLQTALDGKITSTERRVLLTALLRLMPKHRSIPSIFLLTLMT